MLAAEGVDLAFLPSEREMWPSPPEVRLQVGGLAERLEGLVRPGHLDGVATVVARLLHLVGPSRAYFGQKDAQQLAVVRRMVADLAFPNQIVACPTVREPDGLAVSSRNAYLLPDERQRATACTGPWRRVGPSTRPAGATRRPWRRPPARCWRTLPVEPDYVALVDPATFEPVKQAEAGQVLATAARVGRTRLIDNVVTGVSDADPRGLLAADPPRWPPRRSTCWSSAPGWPGCRPPWPCPRAGRSCWPPRTASATRPPATPRAGSRPSWIW